MTENVGHAPLSMFGANMDQISCLLHYMRTLLPTGLVIWGGGISLCEALSSPDESCDDVDILLPARGYEQREVDL